MNMDLPMRRRCGLVSFTHVGLVLAALFGFGSMTIAGGYSEHGECALYDRPVGVSRVSLVDQAPCERQFGSGTGVFGINYLLESGREISLLAQNYEGDDFMEFSLDDLPALPHAEPINGADECYGAMGQNSMTMLCFTKKQD